MKNSILIALLCLLGLPAMAQHLVSGADVSWCTEMEADGRKFYNAAGEERDLFVLMKEIGMEAIRLRVFDDPVSHGYGPWCNKADVVAKAKRAHDAGLDVMIDFHYSDCFADPETQNHPAAWNGMTREQARQALADHTTNVLQALKDEGITPRWVQVGNETNSGIVVPYGTIYWDASGAARFTDYVEMSNAGYDAVKAVFPDAYVIVHLGGTENARWFFPDFLAAGGKVDMIGLSHYPTEDEWNNTDANATHSNVNAALWVSEAIDDFGVPVMLCETGFDVSKPTLASQVMFDLFDRMEQIPQCAGIFYWEPEVDGQWKPDFYDTLGWGAYGMGAFTTDGRPTRALDAFGDNNTWSPYPSTLTIYARDGATQLATMYPVEGEDGAFHSQLDVTEPWQNFQIVDTENNIWYGSDPSDKTKLSSAEDKWSLWIDSEQTGIYDITANLATMTWTHTYLCQSGVSLKLDDHNAHTQWYDLMGNKIEAPHSRGFYIKKSGPKAQKIFITEY